AKEVPKNFPILPESQQVPFRLITRKPIVPTALEVKQNHRARSAKLRIVQKINEWNDEYIYGEGRKNEDKPRAKRRRATHVARSRAAKIGIVKQIKRWIDESIYGEG